MRGVKPLILLERCQVNHGESSLLQGALNLGREPPVKGLTIHRAHDRDPRPAFSFDEGFLGLELSVDIRP